MKKEVEEEVEGDEKQDNNDDASTGGVTHAEKLELVRIKEHVISLAVLIWGVFNVERISSANGYCFCGEKFRPMFCPSTSILARQQKG